MQWKPAWMYNSDAERGIGVTLYMFSSDDYNSYKSGTWVMLAEVAGEFRWCHEGMKTTTWPEMQPVAASSLAEAQKIVEVLARLQLGAPHS